MLTLRAAAAMLAARDDAALSRIASVCGCGGPPRPLDHAAREALGLAAEAGAGSIEARVARGPGSLRALLLDLDAGPVPLRDAVPRLATRLARRAPHLAWLCVAASRGAPRELALASWSTDRIPPRTLALVVDRDDVVDGDAETLCALAAAAGPDDALTHARWLDVLGRQSLSRRFYRGLDGVVGRMAATLTIPPGQRRPSSDEARAIALLYASRLLFLAFLEAKGWLDRDRGFLLRTYTECLGAAGHYHRRVLRPLFFGTLNTPPRRRAPAARAFGCIPFLNGGLFGPTALERRLHRVAFADEAVGAMFGDVLSRYRFTAREDHRTWSEVAIDPEMMGKAFETLMDPGERHATGAYYTPHSLVERMTHDVLAHALATAATPRPEVAAWLVGQDAPPATRSPLREGVSRVRILDPACGSGAFLVHALEALAALAGRVGDDRPVGERRRAILGRSIFGVDINPTAVWLCELRLWLSVVIETDEPDPARVLPLPNLDRHIRIGDALAGGPLLHRDGAAARPMARGAAQRIGRLRERYAQARGAAKRATLVRLEREVRARAIHATEGELRSLAHARRELVSVARGRDLFGRADHGGAAQRERRADWRVRARTLRAQLRALRDGGALPFAFTTHFADVDADGGFDAVIGNPPWVRPHAVTVATRERLRRDFVVARAAPRSPDDLPGRPHRRFGPQVDLAALFVERSVSLIRPGGVVGLLVPAKLWRSLAGGAVRQLVTDRTTVVALEDWSAAAPAFDAATYPSLLLLRRPVLPSSPGDASEPARR